MRSMAFLKTALLTALAIGAATTLATSQIPGFKGSPDSGTAGYTSSTHAISVKFHGCRLAPPMPRVRRVCATGTIFRPTAAPPAKYVLKGTMCQDVPCKIKAGIPFTVQLRGPARCFSPLPFSDTEALLVEPSFQIGFLLAGASVSGKSQRFMVPKVIKVVEINPFTGAGIGPVSTIGVTDFADSSIPDSDKG